MDENAGSDVVLSTDMQIKYGGYRGFKAKMDYLVSKTAEDIVGIGEMLREARDTDILKESGYAGMGEWAEKEYGFHPSQTSRFISIAEKYGNGEGGLRTEYEEYSQTKLSEMLTLPDAVAQAIPPQLTREEIREIKAEVKEEQKITPLEVMAERPGAETENEDALLAMLKAYLQGRPQDARMAERVISKAGADTAAVDVVMDALTPSGVGVLESRPAGMGRMILSIAGRDHSPKLTTVREDKCEEYSWEQVRETLDKALQDVGPAPQQEETEEKPKTEEKLKIAPAQVKPEQGTSNTEPKKPKEDVLTPPRGSEEGRNCIVAIKTKAHNLEMICKSAARMKPDEESFEVQDMAEKFELEAQDMQKMLNDFLTLRLKEEGRG